MANKKKPKNIDEFLEELKGTNSKSIKESFKAYDEFVKPENQDHLYNNVFTPGQDKLYGAIKSKLDKLFEDDDTKVHKKKKEIQKAILEGLKEYFKEVKPSLTQFMDDLDMNEDEQYEYLTQFYDEHVGVDRIKGVKSIKELEEFARNKRTTVGNIKRELYNRKTMYAGGALQMLQGKHLSHHFNKYHPTEIAAYLKPMIKKEGYDIEDKLGYATAPLPEQMAIRAAIVKKEGHKHLKKKDEAA